ncbi:MAG: hypothetical protein HJJLKODD_01876 [Phycisphaerae bacterium]|nr:hypothetical protein [Phycisphaerae bacterium]
MIDLLTYHQTKQPQHWRSLDELADTPEFRRFVDAEFPTLTQSLQSPHSRRQFLQLMGASLGLAGVVGCRWPEQKIAPYSAGIDNRLPGVPVQYATAMDWAGGAVGLLVTSYDGRPIKIEGNPQHPASRGSTLAWQQAAVLGLFDPDRSQSVVERSAGRPYRRSWDDFTAALSPILADNRTRQGQGLVILTEAVSSPTLLEMRSRLIQALPQARWLEYSPVSRDAEREGLRGTFGQPLRAQLHLDQAAVIVSLDDDFLMMHPMSIAYARDFAGRRRVEETTADRPMSRLYVLESMHTVTGAAADHRIALRSQDILPALARMIVQLHINLPAELKSGIEKLATQESPRGLKPELLKHLVDDVLTSKGAALFTAGANQPVIVHALVALVNQALGHVGRTVTYLTDPQPERPSHVDAILQLATLMDAGQVETLVMLGGNPVYDAPAELKLGDLLNKVKISVHLSLYEDETSLCCGWHLPQAHFLESWSDARSWDGTVSIVQPLIEPFFGGRTAAEVVALLLGEQPLKSYELVRRTFGGEQFDETRWEQALHDGVIAGMASPPVTVSGHQASLAETATIFTKAIEQWQAPSSSNFELVFRPDYRVYDGCWANNGWLQEMPDPMTKLVWDNAYLMAPADAQTLGLTNGDMVMISQGDWGLGLPIYVVPGQAAGSITVPLGYGRSAAGKVGNQVGQSGYVLRNLSGMNWRNSVTLTRLNQHRPLVTTQDHHAIRSVIGEQENAQRLGMLVREATLTEYQHHPEFAKHVVHHLPLISLNDEHQYPDHKWGMAIDLNACIGCTACHVACQAENNIPVVGKSEMDRGREMHWIRIDRYFKGEPEAPEVVHQPVTCHHCENAPCEPVCPVAATTHSHEGLNDMVYNRCIGTRYCSNNCPYKVRRFNWFNNAKKLSDLEQLRVNPEVTVRSRGVMEKCTYCVQRINAVKIAAKNDQRPIRDGEITTACAQACPTQAIVFGDLNDPHSAVAKAQARSRAYAMLAELNIKPRTQYLAKIRNPQETDAPRSHEKVEKH